MAPSPYFSPDEKVLCFHHELLYEAKILDYKFADNDDKKKGFLYKVHYKGWKNTWDDWVPQDRLKKFSDENQELAKSLKREMDALRNQNKPSARTSLGTKRKADGSARGSEERGLAPAGKKRGRDFETEKEETYNSKPAVRVVMPDHLKSILVDDWENVTKNLQLAHVPAKIPVNVILDEYLEQERARRGDGTSSFDLLNEVISGMRQYFNKGLGRILLYKYERGQYDEILHRIADPKDEIAGKQLGDVYGAEHLLRLFVSLPELIAQTNMDQQSASRLREELHNLTMWMSKEKNILRYLSSPYEYQGYDYQEKWGSRPVAHTDGRNRRAQP